MPTFFEALADFMAREEPLVTVTVVDTMGSVPQDRGAKMIVTRAGLQFGTVGGGKVETKAIAEAQKMLNGEVAENVGKWRVVIFGAGHVANALITMLIHFDCQIACIDPREEWLSKLPQSPKLTTIQTSDMPSVVKTLPDDAFVVMMTMGHASDAPILIEILRTRRFPYVGVIGSEAKA